MAMRVGWHLALILVACASFGLAQPWPTRAATASAEVGSKPDDSPGAPLSLNAAAKNGARRPTSAAHRKSNREPAKSASGAEIQSVTSLTIPPLLTNANAQITGDHAADGKAIFGRPTDIIRESSDMQSAQTTDQLNEVDRALQEHPGTPTIASAEVPALRHPPVMASSAEGSAWDRTSLIGKIFIGLGVLLTLASTGRMFMA